jgi:hypothetical protein
MSMFQNWVLYREDSNSHEEVYIRPHFRGERETTDDVTDALSFPTAAEAYAFAGSIPELQWWKVGKR